jgi:hypothetical protein
MKENNNTFCIYDVKDGNFRMSILAEDFIVLGADFKIMNTETKEIIENWKFTTDKGKSVYYDIKALPDILNKCNVYWNVVCCSSNSNRYMGKVQIKVMQGNKTLKTTMPTSYKLRNLPPCQLNGSEEFSGNFTFIKNTDINKGQ